MDTVIRFFQEGGSFMLPIAIVLAIGLAITLERYLFLITAPFDIPGLLDETGPVFCFSN